MIIKKKKKKSAVLWPEEGRKKNKHTSNYYSTDCHFKARLLTLKYNPQLTSTMTKNSFLLELHCLHSHLWGVYIILVTEIQLTITTFLSYATELLLSTNNKHSTIAIITTKFTCLHKMQRFLTIGSTNLTCELQMLSFQDFLGTKKFF